MKCLLLSSCRFIYWLLLVLLLVVSILSRISQSCYYGIKSVGKVSPMGDINLNISSTLTINCTLNDDADDSANSSHIKWSYNSTLVDMKYVTVLDERTAQLNKSNATIDDSGTYSCFLKYENISKTICNNVVRIGTSPPQGIKISCLSKNWENLTCTWRIPYNPVITNWSFYQRLIKNSRQECSHYLENRSGCFFDDMTDTPYQPAHNVIYFYLKGKNALGESRTDYKFNHYEEVYPAPPSNLNAVEMNARRLLVTWQVAKPMHLFPPGIYYRLSFKSRWNPTWQEVDVGRNRTDYTLSNLVPYTNYLIRVIGRSAASVNSPWSAPATIEKRTPADVPTGVVNISFFCFVHQKLLNRREVTLYWQSLPEIHFNGFRLGYLIDALEDGLQRNLSLKFKGNNSVTIFNLDLDKTYVFRIRATNEKGAAKKTANLSLDKGIEVPQTPDYLTVISYNDGIYEVSWRWKDESENPVSNFSIVWCNVTYSRPGIHCFDSDIVWTIVEPSVRRVNLSLSSSVNYEFAVSANIGIHSSGLIWARCNNPFNGVVGKMNVVHVEGRTSTEITLSWRLECSERAGILEGFRIYYCIYDNITKSCSFNKEKLEKFVDDPHAIRYSLQGLKPNTMYELSISAVTRAGVGEQSNPLYFSTKEGAPNDCCGLAISSVKNTSAVLVVQPPFQPNGIIRKYKFYLNGNYFAKKSNGSREIRLSPLKSYTNYSVQVKACTLEDLCSPLSQPHNFTTKIGIPSPPEIIKVQQTNLTHLRLDWDDPVDPNGPIMGWVVTFDWTENSKMKTVEVPFRNEEKSSSAGERTLFLALPVSCSSGNKENQPEYNVSIRMQTEMIDGSKSQPVNYNCATMRNEVFSTWVIVVIVISIVALFVGVLYCGVRSLVKKISEMKNIKVQLPQGLDSTNINIFVGYEDFKAPLGPPSSDVADVRMCTTASRRLLCPRLDSNDSTDFKNTDIDFTMSSNGELSLADAVKSNYTEKGGRNLSGDSSGCSSCGHESISSSLTNRTHLSVDSGAEIDLPASPDSVFNVEPLKRFSNDRNKCRSLTKVDEVMIPPKEDDVADSADAQMSYAQLAFLGEKDVHEEEEDENDDDDDDEEEEENDDDVEEEEDEDEDEEDDDDYLTPKPPVPPRTQDSGYSKLGKSSSPLVKVAEIPKAGFPNRADTFPHPFTALNLIIPATSESISSRKPRLPTPPEENPQHPNGMYMRVGLQEPELMMSTAKKKISSSPVENGGYIPLDNLKIDASPEMKIKKTKDGTNAWTSTKSSSLPDDNDDEEEEEEEDEEDDEEDENDDDDDDDDDDDEEEAEVDDDEVDSSAVVFKCKDGQDASQNGFINPSYTKTYV